MKVYFKKKIHLSNDMLKNKKTFSITEYLTDSGKYSIKNNKLINFKLFNLEQKNKDLGNGFIASSEMWKVNNNVYTIPFNHMKITREINKYKVNDKLFYIKEVIDNNIISDYILTTYTIGDKRLMQELNKL